MITDAEGGYVVAAIAMVGAVFAALWKLIQRNGCRCSTNYRSGVPMCYFDFDHDLKPDGTFAKLEEQAQE